MRLEKGRIGQFFIFLGIIGLVIFFTTGQDTTPPMGFFLGGVALLVIGGLLIWKDWKPGPQSSRFRILKKTRKPKKEKEE